MGHVACIAGPTPVRLRCRMFVGAMAILSVAVPTGAGGASALWAAELPPAHAVAAGVDELLRAHWSNESIRPAAPVDDATFLRRVTLDLIGRIPLPSEVDEFCPLPLPLLRGAGTTPAGAGAAKAGTTASAVPNAGGTSQAGGKSDDKRRKLVERLVDSPEFPFYWGGVLDEMIQGPLAGDDAFADYLRRRLRERAGWDSVFRELMLGPWTSDESKAAARFLDKRAKQLDQLTIDATRAFFGVDISCAQCHDHPLVDDWKQDHFYGMASFFNRTTFGGKGVVGEKTDGEVTFVSKGQTKTARTMFLSGRVAEPPAGDAANEGGDSAAAIQAKALKSSRRALLVRAALDDTTFFRRAIVNRVWEQFFARGLVDPVDQMHSANAPSVPGVLELLADDFAAHGYDVRRLILILASTEAYQLDSRMPDGAPVPPPGAFAASRLRPLGRRQMAASLLVATGAFQFANPTATDRRVEQLVGTPGLGRVRDRIELDSRANALAGSLDPRTPDFQSSTAEALFLSNAPSVQDLFQPNDGNVVSRLAAMSDDAARVDATVLHALGRRPTADEKRELTAWLAEQSSDRAKASAALLWALVGSAEFRFR